MLYDKINSDMKSAMINKDKDKLSTIRLLKSAIDLYRINNKLNEVTDEAVIDVASKQIKTHKESIIEFENGGRNDLSEKLKAEIEILKTYLPEQLSLEETEAEINKIFDIIKPQGKQDLGKIMKEISANLKGKVDMKVVNDIVMKKINS